MRKIFVFAFVLAMIFSSFCSAAFATANDNIAKPTAVESFTTRSTKAVYSDGWSTMYHGTGSAVNVTMHNNVASYVSIQMLDYSNNIVWSEYLSLAPSATRQYYVGADVAKVQAMSTFYPGTIDVTVA